MKELGLIGVPILNEASCVTVHNNYYLSQNLLLLAARAIH